MGSGIWTGPVHRRPYRTCSSRLRRTDRARHRIRPRARVERRAAQHQERYPADEEARLGHAGHLERGRFQVARDDDEDDAEDGETVVAAEDGAEDRSGLAARAD